MVKQSLIMIELSFMAPPKPISSSPPPVDPPHRRLKCEPLPEEQKRSLTTNPPEVIDVFRLAVPEDPEGQRAFINDLACDMVQVTATRAAAILSLLERKHPEISTKVRESLEALLSPRDYNCVIGLAEAHLLLSNELNGFQPDFLREAVLFAAGSRPLSAGMKIPYGHRALRIGGILCSHEECWVALEDERFQEVRSMRQAWVDKARKGSHDTVNEVLGYLIKLRKLPPDVIMREIEELKGMYTNKATYPDADWNLGSWILFAFSDLYSSPSPQGIPTEYLESLEEFVKSNPHDL